MNPTAIADILWLESYDWDDYMFLTRDEEWNVLEWISFEDEVFEIIKYVNNLISQ